MKRLTTFLMALMLITLGASAETDFTSRMINTTAYWTGATNTYSAGGVESFQTTAYEAGKVLYQQIANLPAGTYSVTFYAVASSTSSRDGITNDAYGESIAQVFANSTTQDVTVVQQIACTPSDNSYTLVCTVGEDGILEYGLQNVATGGNWYVCQGVSLTLTTDIVTRTLTADEVLEECEAEFNHWTISGNTSGAFQRNTWSGEADASGMKTPFIEYWVGGGSELTAATISHNQIMGLPAGYYTVSIFARAFDEATDETTAATDDIAEGDMFFTANKESIDLTTGTHGIYNDFSREVYGTYELIAEVTETDGTLDIGFTVAAESNCDWLAFKNLKVVYMGESIPYEINAPVCSAKVVQPGDEVSIVYECITPDTDEEPKLDTSKSITVGGTDVGATLDCAGYSATVTFTMPEGITLGEDVTIVVPEGLIYWDLDDADNVLSPAATFTLHTPATIAEGDYLIMNEDGNYLGGGLLWGTQATTIGKPQFIGFEVQDDGTYHLDSHQYNSATAHYLGENLYFDNDTPVDWTLVAMDDGYALYYAGSNHYVTDNGFQVAATLSDEPTVWTLVTMEDVVASMSDVTEDAPVDVTALIAAPELKRNSNSTYDPTWTVTGTVTFGQNSNIGSTTANCAESWHSTGGFDVNQTITLPLAGTYKLSAQGFHDGDATDIVLYAGDDTADFPSASGVADQAAAYQAFLAGTYPVGPITITTTSDEQEVTIGFKGDNSSEWVVMGELGLQYLGVEKETVEWEMTTANWGTLILPFDADVPEGLTIYTCDDTETTTTTDDTTGETTTTTTVVVTEVTDGIAANTPYLVSGTEGAYTFSGTPAELEDGKTLTEGLLTGTFDTLNYEALSALESNGSTVYLLQNHQTTDEDYEEGEGTGVGFYPVNTSSAETGVTLTPYHCYLTLPSGSSGVRAFISLPGDAGEETGIVAVEGTEVADDAIYDLSGRRVAKAVKGVYIQNGKKVLVK